MSDSILTIISCFEAIHSPNTDPITRKNADRYLLDAEKDPLSLLPNLMEIVQTCPNDQIKLQALLFFSNVIKRTWTSRRLKQVHSAYEGMKKSIRTKILLDLYQSPKFLLYTYFDITKYIVKIDFPHHFPQFTQLVVKMTEQISIDENSVTRFKEMKEIFNELGQRKGCTSMKLYQQNLQPIVERLCMASGYFKDEVQRQVEQNILDSSTAKLSKYMDQIILSILRMAPNQLLDSQQTLLITKQLQGKLEHLLVLHKSATSNSKTRGNLQKNIKSLIYDISSLGQANPFMISAIVGDYFTTLAQIIVDPATFTNPTVLKYSLLAMRKFIREFSYYSDDSQFMTSIGSKPKSKNYLNLRSICHTAYTQSLTPQFIQGLLNHMIVNVMCVYCKSENSCFDVEENMIIDRSQEKELGMENCAILLIEAVLERFAEHAHELVKNMVVNAWKSNFQGISPSILNNIFGVLALLPKTSKKNTLLSLTTIPIVQILGFIYQNPLYKNKIPVLISGWFDYFTNDQLVSLIGVLLDFIQNQQDTGMILHCCQSLDKIIVTKKYLLNVDTIAKIFPIAIRTFQKTDSPQVLWPMVNLISNMITLCEFDSDIILNSLQGSSLQILISSQSTLLIQALSQMFKNILCVIPRHKQAQTVYHLVSCFLNNHLGKLSAVNSQKVLNLWYITLREYSTLQNCNQQLIQLYHTHYKNMLFYKTPTLIYILQEYMLLGFVQQDVAQFSLLIYEFYQQANQMEKGEAEMLKIAALSFQITLITKYTLAQVNNSDMLQAMLKDFYTLDTTQVSATVHNSLLSIINRYLILHRQSFFDYLTSINADLNQFYLVYLDNMEFLTSQSAKKINAIAVLCLMNMLPSELLVGKLHYILMTVVPSVETYKSMQYINPLTSSPFTGKVMNSPTLRFASNFLSQRKQEIRKKDMFEEFNLTQIFKTQINNACMKLGTNVETIAQNFPQNGWGQRFYKLLQ